MSSKRVQVGPVQHTFWIESISNPWMSGPYDTARAAFEVSGPRRDVRVFVYVLTKDTNGSPIGKYEVMRP